MFTRIGTDFKSKLADQTGGYEIVTASLTIDREDVGKTFGIGTDALVMTLPLIGAETFPIGSELKFINIGANGNNIITLSPNSANKIVGTIQMAAADATSGGVLNKDWINTKATAKKGDYVVLKAISTTEWFIIGGVGIWASEA